MLGFIKKTILNSKQGLIRRKYPGVNIILHQDMPHPSIVKMTQLAGIVAQVNALEEAIQGLSNEQLRAKTAEFR